METPHLRLAHSRSIPIEQTWGPEHNGLPSHALRETVVPHPSNGRTSIAGTEITILRFFHPLVCAAPRTHDRSDAVHRGNSIPCQL